MNLFAPLKICSLIVVLLATTSTSWASELDRATDELRDRLGIQVEKHLALVEGVDTEPSEADFATFVIELNRFTKKLGVKRLDLPISLEVRKENYDSEFNNGGVGNWTSIFSPDINLIVNTHSRSPSQPIGKNNQYPVGKQAVLQIYYQVGDQSAEAMARELMAFSRVGHRAGLLTVHLLEQQGIRVFTGMFSWAKGIAAYLNYVNRLTEALKGYDPYQCPGEMVKPILVEIALYQGVNTSPLRSRADGDYSFMSRYHQAELSAEIIRDICQPGVK